MAAVVVFVVFAYIIAIVLLPLATIVLLLAYFYRKLHPHGETPGILASLVMPAGMVLNVVALPIGICWLWVFGIPRDHRCQDANNQSDYSGRIPNVWANEFMDRILNLLSESNLYTKPYCCLITSAL